MAMVTIGSQTTNEEMKPTSEELIDYIYAIGDLIACKAVKIKGYKPNHFENVVLDCDYECMIECTNILNEFKKNYPNSSLK